MEEERREKMRAEEQKTRDAIGEVIARVVHDCAERQAPAVELPEPVSYWWSPKGDSGINPSLACWSGNSGPHPSWDITPHYTADQVREAVLRERERCARICESVNNYDNPMTNRDCADEIRKGT